MRASWFLVFVLAACSDDIPEAETQEKVTDFSLPGAFTPGTSSSTVSVDDELSLKVETWFPSSDVGSDLVAHDGFYVANAYTDVTPECSEPLPVLLFSHGNSGIRWQSPFFVEHLASHGYLVAAPDHTFNTVFDDDPSRFDELVLRRPRDLQVVFDWLVAQSEDSESELFGCVDPEAGYAVAGHSFGGYTALAAAGALVWGAEGVEQDLGDERVWASIPLAPWDARGAITDGSKAIDVPVMILTGDADLLTDLAMVEGLYDPLTVEPRHFGRFTRGGHYSFSPMACDLGLIENDGCGPDALDLEVVAELTTTAAMAFLESVRGFEGAEAQMPSDSDEMVWRSSPD